MSIKSKNKRVGICLIVGTICIVVAGFWAALATPETALAAPPEGKGKGGGDAPNCVKFDDGNDSVRSDDPPGDPYCDNKKAKITVTFSQDGHLELQTNSSAKAGAGRGLFIDFGTDVTLAPGTDNELTIQTTEEALADTNVLAVSACLGVGGCQDAFNFFDMDEGVPDENVNLWIRVHFYFTDGSSDSLLIRLAPNEIDNGRHCPSSDDVTVTYDGIVDELRQWRVKTQPVVHGAGISRSGEGEFGDGNLLTDVDDDPDLAPGHIALSFGFTVTAAP